MADGKGECCIARWGGGGHVAAAAGDYGASKMDMIMLKFRPIAPKPVTGAAPASDGGSQGNGSGSGRQAKAGCRGRKKSSSSNNTTKCNNNGRKRKSSSPDRKHVPDGNNQDHDDNIKGDLTLLPLFPEAPDLSPTSQVHNMPFWLNFDNNNDDYTSGSSPSFEGNYNWW